SSAGTPAIAFAMASTAKNRRIRASAEAGSRKPEAELERNAGRKVCARMILVGDLDRRVRPRQPGLEASRRTHRRSARGSDAQVSRAEVRWGGEGSDTYARRGMCARRRNA